MSRWSWHLYRLVKERVFSSDQAKAVSLMSTTVPQERFPEALAWLFPLIGLDDRENLVLIWQMGMPPQVFEGVKQLIKRAIGSDWTELTERIPSLA